MEEERKGENPVESLDVDMTEIRDMQQTQALKKIEAEKIQEVKKEEVKEKKNHPIYVTILIIILMIVFLCMGFFGGIYYYKNSIENKPEEKEEKKESKTEEKKSTVQKVELSENDISKYDLVMEKMTFFLAGFYPVNNISDISKDEFMLKMWSLCEKCRSVSTVGSSFDRADFASVIKEYFGSDFNYQDGDIIYGTEKLYTYDANTQKYTRVNEAAYGEISRFEFKKYFQKAEEDKENGKLTIQYKIIYTGYLRGIAGPSTKLYVTAKDAMNLNATYELESGKYIDNVSDIDKYADKVLDKTPITTFHFERDSEGNYGLKSIAIN